MKYRMLNWPDPKSTPSPSMIPAKGDAAALEVFGKAHSEPAGGECLSVCCKLNNVSIVQHNHEKISYAGSRFTEQTQTEKAVMPAFGPPQVTTTYCMPHFDRIADGDFLQC